MFASYIVGAARTPRGRGKREKGALAGIHPQELFAQTLATLKERLGFEPRDVDDVIAGCVSQVGEQGANMARNAVLAAGWPDEVSAVSLNRFCASGLQAIHFGAMGVASGAMDFVIAGGVEACRAFRWALMVLARTATTPNSASVYFKSLKASAPIS